MRKTDIQALLRKHSLPIFYIICYLFLLFEWIWFTQSIGGMGAKFIVTVAKGIGDCAALFIVYWLLPPKKAWLLLIMIWMISVFFLFNEWHCRFWGDFIPATFYRLSSNLNMDLINSVKALVNFPDCVYILIPTLCTASYILFFKKHILQHDGISRKYKLIVISISLTLFALSQLAFNITISRWNRNSGLGATSFHEITQQRITAECFPCKFDFQKEGLSIYFLRASIEIIRDLTTKHTIELKQNDIDNISEFLDNIPEFTDIPALKGNTNKSIIIIVVESLNADVVFRNVNGHEITPVMNFLVEREGSISSLNMIPQVKQGCSNDGQQLINTGLLPLNNGVSSMLFSHKNVFPDLGKIMNIEKPIAIFGDNGNTWNQTRAYQSYGFKEIYNINHFNESAKRIGRDAALFNFANRIIDGLKSPFLVELVTFSMHVPFMEECVPMQSWLNTDDLSLNEKNYLNMVNYFDMSLGCFLEYLKSANLFDNTVIFIVSDHSQGLGVSSSQFRDGNNNHQDSLPMIFLAINTGVTKKITATTGQVNVFPTILHIMNRLDGKYRGLGRSLLDPELSSAVTTHNKIKGNTESEDISAQTRAFEISDSIQRGDFFRFY